MYTRNTWRRQTQKCLVCVCVFILEEGISQPRLEKKGNFLSQYMCSRLKKKKKKKREMPINFNANYRREMKHVPISMDYCLFQFDTLIFFFRVRLYGESAPNFNFFNVNSQIWLRNRKVQAKSAWIKIFKTILNLMAETMTYRRFFALFKHISKFDRIWLNASNNRLTFGTKRFSD